MRLYCSFSGTQKSTGRRDFLAPKPVLRLEHLSLLPWSFACTSPNISCFTVFIRPRVSHVWFFAIPWTVARQVPLSTGFSRQEYWSGWPFSSPGDLPDLGIEPGSPALQVDSLPSKAFPPDSHQGSPSHNLCDLLNILQELLLPFHTAFFPPLKVHFLLCFSGPQFSLSLSFLRDDPLSRELAFLLLRP